MAGDLWCDRQLENTTLSPASMPGDMFSEFTETGVQSDHLMFKDCSKPPSHSARSKRRRSRDTFLRGARILAIDDSRTYLTELSNKLTANGFQVSTASSGPEGLELLRTGSFHIAVVDVIMPEMDGFEVCRRARQWAAKDRKHLGGADPLRPGESRSAAAGLDSGADDLSARRSTIEIILAHIKSLVRRVRMMRHIQTINEKTYQQEIALREASGAASRPRNEPARRVALRAV